jgi:osmotically-inducible protein OsmY
MMQFKRVLAMSMLLLSALSLQGCFPLAAVGVGATALAVDDRRSTGIYVEDENIEWKARALMLREFKEPHINITAFNLNVLLTGEASSEKMKTDVADAVRKIASVKNVTNEIVVAGNSALTARASDSLTTTNVKARLLGTKGVTSNHIKVVTESGVVYLMGLVTKEEGDAAVEVARNTSGVSRVVKVFEAYTPK